MVLQIVANVTLQVISGRHIFKHILFPLIGASDAHSVSNLLSVAPIRGRHWKDGGPSFKTIRVIHMKFQTFIAFRTTTNDYHYINKFIYSITTNYCFSVCIIVHFNLVTVEL